MPLKQHLERDLTRLKFIVSSIDDSQFIKPLRVLSESSIGQHVRHIVEFYLTVSESTLSDLISYDIRKRDRAVETDRQRCLDVIDSIIKKMQVLDETKAVVVAANYDEGHKDVSHHPSTVSRELGYVLEHSIHHQAMMKIGLSELGQQLPLPIGIAPATVRFKNHYS